MLDTNKVMTYRVGIYCDGLFIIPIGNNKGYVEASYNQVSAILNYIKPIVANELYIGHYVACEIINIETKQTND